VIEHRIDRFLITEGRATCIVGLPEEVVAMAMAFYSRNPRSIRDTLIHMVDSGNLVLPESTGVAGESVRKFHKRITIGYGHKSVADHAQVHWVVEGVSAVLERDFLSARLLAASSVSTRYVDFRSQGCVFPEEWPDRLRLGYAEHCSDLIDSYVGLVPVATAAVRDLMPWKPDLGWKTERGWEIATEKRALDALRDLLPYSVKTSFGVSMSATALREFLDKRDSAGNIAEVREVSKELRKVCHQAYPSLVPMESREIARHADLPRSCSDESQSLIKRSSVSVITSPDWRVMQKLYGAHPAELVRRLSDGRAHKMGPDRMSEFARYVITGSVPIAIFRDLGRHRMMTQVYDIPWPWSGYGTDPLLDANSYPENIALAAVKAGHTQALAVANDRLLKWSGQINSSVLQYACPLATMVNFAWEVSLRQLVYLIGLRTTPQGHPGYRVWTQALAKALMSADPFVAGLIESVTNFDDILVGRPD
jgi:thymidylate synthase ThyX